MEKTDQELVKEYIAGHHESFDLLVSKYIKNVFNFVKRLQNNTDDATDITQEVFLKVWKKIKSFDPKQSFKTWLFTIARNTTIDWMRKKKTYVFSDFDNDYTDESFEDKLVDEEPLPDALFEKKETKSKVENLLKEISLDQRTIIVLHAIEGLTFEEASIVLGKPLNTVKSHYRRGLGSLRQKLLKGEIAPN